MPLLAKKAEWSPRPNVILVATIVSRRPAPAVDSRALWLSAGGMWALTPRVVPISSSNVGACHRGDGGLARTSSARSSGVTSVSSIEAACSSSCWAVRRYPGPVS